MHERYQQLSNKEVIVTPFWVPSHVGIVGNKLADRTAKDASVSNLPVEKVQLYQELKNFF